MDVPEQILNIVVGTAYSHHHKRIDVNCNDTAHSKFNVSMDVLRNTCFANYDTLACVRSTVLVFLTAVTGMCCAARIVNLHISGHPNYYQYAIFYLAVVQCIVGTVEWVLGWTVHASLACLYLRSLELVVICHFYLTLASRVTRRSNGLASRLSAAILSLFLTYFTSFIIIGFVFSGQTYCDCFANYWLFLSGGQLVLIQLLAAAAILIVHRVNAVRAQESFKRTQRRGVWILIFSFEISAFVCISYHVVVWSLATEEEGCSGVFLHKQLIYSPVRIAHEVLTSLLPLWAMLYVFKPVQKSQTTDVIGSSESGDRRRLLRGESLSTQSSILDPASTSSNASFARDWRRRRHHSQFISPAHGRTLLTDSRLAAVPSSVSGRPRRLRSFVVKKLASGGVRIRRSSSAPGLRFKRTPPLATIPEEPLNSSNSPGSSSPGPRSPPKASSVDYVGDHGRQNSNLTDMDFAHMVDECVESGTPISRHTSSK